MIGIREYVGTEEAEAGAIASGAVGWASLGGMDGSESHAGGQWVSQIVTCDKALLTLFIFFIFFLLIYFSQHVL
jgi:hypothetical protein